jgi:hypothetical protein
MGPFFISIIWALVVFPYLCTSFFLDQLYFKRHSLLPNAAMHAAPHAADEQRG